MSDPFVLFPTRGKDSRFSESTMQHGGPELLRTPHLGATVGRESTLPIPVADFGWLTNEKDDVMKYSGIMIIMH